MMQSKIEEAVCRCYLGRRLHSLNAACVGLVCSRRPSMKEHGFIWSVSYMYRSES